MAGFNEFDKANEQIVLHHAAFSLQPGVDIKRDCRYTAPATSRLPFRPWCCTKNRGAAIIAKDHRRSKACAIYPISGGPKKTDESTVDTTDRHTAGIVLVFPGQAVCQRHDR